MNEKNNQQNLTAVALQYEHGQDLAPKVTAKGKGYMADKIIAIAKEHGIDIHHDAELAQVLSVLDIDTIIPVEAYAAVAEILSYIYQTNAKLNKK